MGTVKMSRATSRTARIPGRPADDEQTAGRQALCEDRVESVRELQSMPSTKALAMFSAEALARVIASSWAAASGRFGVRSPSK